MRVFVTGASGFIGRAVIPELIGAGHEVIGLARSDGAVETVVELGGQVVRGSLDDLDVIAKAADDSDGVIHLAFIHDWGGKSNPIAADDAAIRAMGDALAGSERPLVITSGTLGIDGTTELDPPSPANPRGANATTALSYADRGVRATSVRLSPSVYDAGDGGFVPALINFAKTAGFVGYPGDGSTQWTAVHRQDAASLFRLALEKGAAGSSYHGVGEAPFSQAQLASAIAEGTGLAVQPVADDKLAEYYTWMAGFIQFNSPATSEWTQQQLGWKPTGLGLFDDMKAHYF